MLDHYIPSEKLIEISLISVLNVSVFITITLIIMSLLLRKGRLVKKVGPACIIYLLIALIIRMFIPIEFNFANELVVYDVLTNVFDFFIHPIRIGNLLVINVYHILAIIWGIGVIISLLLKYISYRKLRRYTSILPVSDIEEIKGKLSGIKNIELLDTVRVAYSSEISSPYLIGFFKPLVVLPKIEYTNEELRYIVTHELMHAKNKDIFWKILSDILCTIFWWNPIFNYLRDQLFKMIEIRNDCEIIKNFSDSEIVGYLECLMNTAINLSGKDVLFSVSFSKSNFKELQLRMGLVAENRKFSKKAQIMLTTLVVVTIFATAFFVVEPTSFPNESEMENAVPLTAENTFLVECEDGYEVYVYGEYLITTNDLRPFKDVPIYSSLEEAQND